MQTKGEGGERGKVVTGVICLLLERLKNSVWQICRVKGIFGEEYDFCPYSILSLINDLTLINVHIHR